MPAGGRRQTIARRATASPYSTVGGFTGGIAFSPKDELIACNPSQGLVRIDSNGKWSLFASHAGSQKMICPNFPVFDRRGHLYVTDSGQWKKQNGFLLRFSPEGTGEIIAGPFGYANGLALSADEKRLFMVESNTDRIFVFDLQAGGTIGPPQVFAESVGRLPDGL